MHAEKYLEIHTCTLNMQLHLEICQIVHVIWNYFPLFIYLANTYHHADSDVAKSVLRKRKLDDSGQWYMPMYVHDKLAKEF